MVVSLWWASTGIFLSICICTTRQGQQDEQSQAVLEACAWLRVLWPPLQEGPYASARVSPRGLACLAWSSLVGSVIKLMQSAAVGFNKRDDSSKAGALISCQPKYVDF